MYPLLTLPELGMQDRKESRSASQCATGQTALIMRCPHYQRSAASNILESFNGQQSLEATEKRHRAYHCSADTKHTGKMLFEEICGTIAPFIPKTSHNEVKRSC